MIRVVAAAVVEAGRVLVARRGPGMSHPGCWELPGGKVEAGEADAVALRRELREELSLAVDVGARVGTSRVSVGAKTIEMHAYACVRTGPMPVATEHDALRWVGPGELAALGWAPADIPLIPALRGLLSGTPC